MRNLFSINKTNDRDATDFDQNPYEVAHVSDEVRHKLEHALDDPDAPPEKPAESEEALAQKRKVRRYWIICTASLVAALGGFALERREMLPKMSVVWNVVYFGLLIVCIIFNFKARRLSNKLRATENPLSDVNIEAATERLGEAAAEAARELGVPADTPYLEILPYHYKMSGETPVDAAKRNHFDNIAVSAWVESDALHLATAQELYRIPLADIRGYRAIDEEFTVDYWLKEEESDSETYREYNIRKSGFMARKLRLYYAVELTTDYEFFVPCYDLGVLKKLVKLNEFS